MRRRFSLVLVLLLVLLAGVGESGSAMAAPDPTPLASETLAKKRTKKRVKKPKTTPPKTTPPKTTPPSRAGSGTSHAPVRAKPRPASPVPAPDPVSIQLEVQRHTLQNGTRVVLQPDPSLPSVAVSVAYRAGSAFEAEGQRGFSHAIFRHLASHTGSKPGAPSLPPARSHFNRDLITFTTVVPPQRAPIALWREADRIAHPVDAASLASLEPELRSANKPPRVRAEELAYQGSWPYGHDAFGWNDDLEGASAADLEAFRRRLMAPSRTVVSVAGRFDPEAMLETIRRLFGPLPPLIAAPTLDVSVPDQINQRVDLSKSAQPVPQYFVYGWAVPPAGHADLAAIRLAMAMLEDRTQAGARTRSTRLAKLPMEAALSIQLDERSGPSMLTLRVDLPASLDMDETRRVVDEAMLELATHGPTTAEMQMAWRQAQRTWLESIASLDGRAHGLARAELLRDGANAIATEPAALVAANREEVRRAVRVYLTPIRRNLVERRGPRVESE